MNEPVGKYVLTFKDGRCEFICNVTELIPFNGENYVILSPLAEKVKSLKKLSEVSGRKFDQLYSELITNLSAMLRLIGDESETEKIADFIVEQVATGLSAINRGKHLETTYYIARYEVDKNGNDHFSIINDKEIEEGVNKKRDEMIKIRNMSLN